MFTIQELGWYMIGNSVLKTGTGVVPDLTFVILLRSSVPNTRTGVVLDLTFVILLGSSVHNIGTGVVPDLTFVILIGNVFPIQELEWYLIKHLSACQERWNKDTSHFLIFIFNRFSV